jgi:hypothetical protein
VKKIILLSSLFIGTAFTNLYAQGAGANKVVNAKTLSDEPYGINKLWLHFQPAVADVFSTNFSLGYGAQVNYFVNDKIDIDAKFNGAYGTRFDFARNLATKNAEVIIDSKKYALINSFGPYFNMQLGGSYHAMDREIKGSSKIMLTPKKLKQIQTTNVDHVVVNSKVRRIAGVRGGAFMYTSTTNLGSAMLKQEKVLTSEDGTQTLEVNNNNRIYSSVFAPGFYLGGSYGTIRNIAIKADKFGILGNTTMFTAYADLMYSPSIAVDNVIIREPGQVETTTYLTDNIKLNRLGWRAGFDIMYNQDSYFSFGGEIGARPAIGGRGIYALAKIGFPAFSFKFKQARTVNNISGMD